MPLIPIVIGASCAACWISAGFVFNSAHSSCKYKKDLISYSLCFASFVADVESSLDWYSWMVINAGCLACGGGLSGAGKKFAQKMGGKWAKKKAAQEAAEKAAKEKAKKEIVEESAERACNRKALCRAAHSICLADCGLKHGVRPDQDMTIDLSDASECITCCNLTLNWCMRGKWVNSPWPSPVDDCTFPSPTGL